MAKTTGTLLVAKASAAHPSWVETIPARPWLHRLFMALPLRLLWQARDKALDVFICGERFGLAFTHSGLGVEDFACHMTYR